MSLRVTPFTRRRRSSRTSMSPMHFGRVPERNGSHDRYVGLMLILVSIGIVLLPMLASAFHQLMAAK